MSGGTWKDLVHSISYGQAGNQVAKFYNQKSIDINKIGFVFFGDLRFCDANTVNGGAVVVRADMSIYKCMAYFLHFEGAHTEQYLNCVDGTLERKTRLTGSRCSELSSGRGLIFSLRLRYKKGLLSGLLTPVAASSSIISRKCSR